VKTDLLKNGAISRLQIARASKRDTGNYTCKMRNALASVIVHILNGKSTLDSIQKNKKIMM
ncbi:Putative LOC101460593, partial [Caligus rogercresseyi]